MVIVNNLTKRLSGEFYVMPQQIDLSGYQMWNAFDACEPEISAWWLVSFALERNKGWAPFTQEEVDAFYNKHYKGHLGFKDLRGEGDNAWIIEDAGLFYFTEGFVARCYETNPKK